MSIKRIIPCLDVKDSRVVKGINFVNLKDMGDPVELARAYDQAGADELVFLDISKTQDGHDLMLDVIEKTAQAISIPLTVGGGIQTLADIDRILAAGASAVSIGTAALKDPDFVTEAVAKYGSQKLVAAVDIQFDPEQGDFYVYSHGGNQRTEWKAFDWLIECEKLGFGQLLITNKDRDGVQNGFDLDFLKQASQVVSLPIIASGGAGSIDDFVTLFEETTISAGLAASIFHNGTVTISDLKERLVEGGIAILPTKKPDFEKANGLISAILQDVNTKQVLMNGFMNEEAYRLTIQDNVVWFYSRTKNRLWKKGETSQHYQYVKGMSLDCDADALLIQVQPAGPTCHLGTASCFDQTDFSLNQLFQTVKSKLEKREEGSYTAYLAQEGLDKILKKCGEELTETVIAAKNNDAEELVSESSDLLYHLFVLLAYQGVDLSDVEALLASRHGNKQNYRVRKTIDQW